MLLLTSNMSLCFLVAKFLKLGILWYWMCFNKTRPILGMSAGDATEAIVG